jgi:hypothetical protein
MGKLHELRCGQPYCVVDHLNCPTISYCTGWDLLNVSINNQFSDDDDDDYYYYYSATRTKKRLKTVYAVFAV